MKILILSASLPYPPASGGALRVYGILKGLHQAGHDITLLTFHDGKPEATPLDSYCRRIVTVPSPHRTKKHRLRDLLLSRQPDIARRLYSEAFVEKLRELLNETGFDLIQFEGIEVACYIPFARQMQPDAKLCFDTFNAEYLLQRVIFQIDRREIKRLPMAAYSLVQARRIKRFERAMCQLADVVIAVSYEDAEALKNFRDDRRVYIVSSGINVDEYGDDRRNGSETRSNENTLVFTGKMDYRPNVDAMLWFAQAVLPKIRQAIPDVKLSIVGQMPHPRLDRLRSDPNITLTGRVESVTPYLHDAAVYIAPLRMGSGTRLKLLEAMASGCAIVATPAAAAGLHPLVKEAMQITENPSDMAQAITQLLQSSGSRQSLGSMARRKVSQFYDWSVLIPRLLTVYKEIGLG